MSKPLQTFFVLFALIRPALATDPAVLNALGQLVDAEKSFARASIEHGIRASFLQFLADDSIMFDPGPTDGKRLYTNYTDKGRKLIWHPSFATISNAGDLGVTAGPWELKKSATDETPLGFGHFVSVWKKQPSGPASGAASGAEPTARSESPTARSEGPTGRRGDNSWKVAVDVGVENPQPLNPPGEIQLFPPHDSLRNIKPEPQRRALQNAEKTFTEAVKTDAGAAVTNSASDDIRVFRDNAFPAVGKTAARLMLSADRGKMTRQTSGGGMSASNDLAYRYGAYSSQRGNITEQGHFLTIWKPDPNREWKIVLDLQKKTPPPEKK